MSGDCVLSTSSTFKAGEVVNVKRHGNAVVVSGPVSDPGHQFHGRYLVQYPDGSMYHAQPNTLRRFQQPPARVLVAETTDHYREAAQTYCHPGDVVLEVGSSHGVTCDLIHQRGALVIGVDKCRELVAEAKAKFPHLRFEAVDAFDLAALQALSPNGSFDKICIDIGGIAELHTVMSLLGLYFRSFRKAVLIVKSKYLKTFLGNAQVYVPPREQEQKVHSLQKQKHKNQHLQGNSQPCDGVHTPSQQQQQSGQQVDDSKRLEALAQHEPELCCNINSYTGDEPCTKIYRTNDSCTTQLISNLSIYKSPVQRNCRPVERELQLRASQV